MPVSRTVIISCAGMGNRLGLGTTKALVEVEGKPLIMHHLEKLKNSWILLNKVHRLHGMVWFEIRYVYLMSGECRITT